MGTICSAPAEDRLRESFSEKVNFGFNEWGCDLWLGAKTSGYGRINVRDDGRLVQCRAHVLAWEWKNGSVPEGLHLDHFLFPGACIGPSCCNPDHVKPVTQRQNVLRGSGPPAVNARKTHCVRGHEYTPDTTYYRPNGHRACRTCRNEQGY